MFCDFPKYKHLKQTIFRGPGGTGSATSDSDTTEFQEFLVQSQAAQAAAEAARDAALIAETNAETAETNAETAETNAAASANAAQDWATKTSGPVAGGEYSAKYNAQLAATSANAAAASLDAFDDRYLGDKASDPTVDNDGNPLIAGTQYFDTVNNEIKVYNGTSWQSASVVGGTVTNLTVTNPITGSITGNAATVTDGVVTTGSYADPVWITSLAGSKVSGNISGNAANVTGTVAIANGGTGQTTRQNAMDALAGAVTNGQYLRGNGTEVVMSAIQVADVPTLNQNTTGTASNVTGIVAVANGGTGVTTSTGSGSVVLSSSPTLTTPNINSAQFATVSGTAPIYPCRAWVNFDGTGTVAIRASGNVSSITDNGVGDYTVNFTTAMPDANYSSTITSSFGSTYAFAMANTNSSATITAPTTSAMRFAVIAYNASDFQDCQYLHVAIFR